MANAFYDDPMEKLTMPDPGPLTPAVRQRLRELPARLVERALDRGDFDPWPEDDNLVMAYLPALLDAADDQDRLRTENTRLRALLLELEWVQKPLPFSQCPVCRMPEYPYSVSEESQVGPHAPDCRLRAALEAAPPESP